MNKYQYILLDWDGNLAKTLDIWLEACRESIEKRGLHLSDLEIAHTFGALVKCLTELGVKDIDETIDEITNIAKLKLPEVELYPDALEVLEELSNRGKTLALITTSKHENVRRLLDKYDITHIFSVIVAGDDVTHHKPHAEPLLKAMGAIGATLAETIMIGDTEKDVGAANNAGVASILFYPPEHKKFYNLDSMKEHNPTHVVEDFKEILTLV